MPGRDVNLSRNDGRKSEKRFKKILVVKLADIGDVLTATPALRALRQTFSEAHISALVTPASASVLEDSPLVDNLVLFDKHEFDRIFGAISASSIQQGIRLLARLRREAYDCVVILHHLVTRWGTLKYAGLAIASGARYRVGIDNGRGWFLTHRAKDHGFGFMHEVEYALAAVRAIGASTNNRQLEITVKPEDFAVADQMLASIHARPLIAIHPGSGTYSTLRRWPAESFSYVGDSLAETEGAEVIIVGGPEEMALCQAVADRMSRRPLVLAGKTTVKQLAAVLSHCDLFVGNDSGVMHVAAAVGTGIVAVFGPSNHLAWGPWAGSAIGEEPTPFGAVIRGSSSCSPCLYGADWGRRKYRPRCAAECLLQIGPDAVARTARQVLAARRAKVEIN